MPSGQPPAKALLELSVIHDLRPARPLWMLLIRGLLAGAVGTAVVVVTLGLALLVPFTDRYRQNVWDLVSGCYVVHDPNDAWHTRRSGAARMIAPASA